MKVLKFLTVLFFFGGVMRTELARASEFIWKGRAVLTVKRDKIVEFKKAVSKIIKPTLEEEGCISYEAYQVVDENKVETNVFEFHELWKTKEAMLIDHKENSPHMKQFFKEIKADSDSSFLESFEVFGKYVKTIN